MTTTNGTSNSTLHAGWYLLALDEEIKPGVTPHLLGRRALIAVRDGDEIRVYDGTCPHRGANLGYGGALVPGGLRCPFHGKRIALGEEAPGRWRVAEHRVLRIGAAVFVRLSTDVSDDRGFEQTMKELAATRTFVGALTQDVPTPPEYVVENAFDIDHFSAVHLVPRTVGMTIGSGEHGDITFESAFVMKRPPWERNAGTGEFHSRFFARAFSPSIVVTEVGASESSQIIITGANPVDGGCVARVVLGLLPEQLEQLEPLITGAKHAFNRDLVVWRHLDVNAPVRWDKRDEPVIKYREFCDGFAGVGLPCSA